MSSFAAAQGDSHRPVGVAANPLSDGNLLVQPPHLGYGQRCPASSPSLCRGPLPTRSHMKPLSLMVSRYGILALCSQHTASPPGHKRARVASGSNDRSPMPCLMTFTSQAKL